MGGSASTHWSSNGYYHSPPFAARRRLDAGPLPSSSSTTGGGGGPAGQLASSSRASHGFLGGIRDRLRQAARHNSLPALRHPGVAVAVTTIVASTAAATCTARTR